MQLIKVIIVDDEYLIIQRLKKIIAWEDYGFKVCADAKDAFDAMQKIEIYKPDFVITDIRMPEMDGLDLCQWSKQRYPLIKFLILSGYQEFSYVQRALRLGVDDFLVKPIDEFELIEALKRIYSTIQARQRESTYFEKEIEEYQCTANRIWDCLMKQDLYALEVELDTIMQITREQGYHYLVQVAFYLTDHMIRLQGYSFDLLRTSVQLRQTLSSTFESAQWREEFMDFLKGYYSILEHTRTNAEESVYQNVMKYVSQNYMNNIGLNELSQALEYNASYLSRLIKKHTGKGCTEIIIDYRIQKAKEMLSETAERIHTISTRVGFTDVKYFSLTFKKKVGVTPKEYRVYMTKKKTNNQTIEKGREVKEESG